MSEYIIQKSRGWCRIPWREIVEYRDLMMLLVRRDFVSKYKQTILGPLWFVLQPLLTTLVFTVIFGGVAKIPTDGLPMTLFYLCGTLGWTYFSQCMSGTASTFVGNAHIFGKVYFPRLVVPLSVVISNLMAFVIQLATFLAFWVYFKFCTNAASHFHATWMIALLPLLLLQSAMIGLGVGLWIASLSAKYRDFAHVSALLTQLWMYATPVVYPLSQVPARWRWVCSLNPMAGTLECYRYAFLGAGTVDPRYIGISIATTVFILFTGLLMFTRTERTFIDTV